MNMSGFASASGTLRGSSGMHSDQWTVLFLGTVEVESMTGSNAVVRSIDTLMEEFHPGRQTTECQVGAMTWRSYRSLFLKCVFLFAAETLRRWSHFNRHTEEALLQKTLSTFFCFLLWHRSQRQKVSTSSITTSPSSSSSPANVLLCLHSWSSAELAARNITSSRLFGLITRKQSQSSVTDNLCHVFCELSPMHSAASIVASINRYLNR